MNDKDFEKDYLEDEEDINLKLENKSENLEKENENVIDENNLSELKEPSQVEASDKTITENQIEVKNQEQEQEQEQKIKENKTSNKIAITSMIICSLFMLISIFVLRTTTFLLQKNNMEQQQQISTNENTSSITTNNNSNINVYTDNILDLSDIIEKVLPSVVSITGTIELSYDSYKFDTEASGSGTIVSINDDEVCILTNYHVIENLDNIKIIFSNNDAIEKNVVVKSVDYDKDLAVISLETKNLSTNIKEYIKAATLSTVKPKMGNSVIVIGNSLGYGISATTGIVSSASMTFNNNSYILTNASINQGNSGGPLVNINGEIIGIVNMKIAETDVEGMGFGIPIYETYGLISELIAFTPLEEYEQGYLGVAILDVQDNVYGIPEGIFVSEVVEGYAAFKAGIKPKDIIVEINNKKITTATQLSDTIKNIKAGETVTVKIMRLDNGIYKEFSINVILSNRP